ncbi:hypothetical protein LCGC14_1749460 [marine sediment metagenome]|uniref:Uncharacterized protein n=1 Tax=marine sediment metagenome TaxID=412755 RepID=A0A0F9JJG8_9ZZZZ
MIVKDNGNYKLLYDKSFQEAAEEWLKDCILWSKGEHPDQREYKDISTKYFWQWNGNPPDEEYYRPEWNEEERTHIQMYEDTSEGTPISPVMKTPEKLARWLTDNNASAFGGMTATYEEWLNTIKRGYSVGMIYSPETGLKPGTSIT